MSGINDASDPSSNGHAWLKLLKEGDPDAFSGLWAENVPHLLRICRHYLRNYPEEIEDVLGDVRLRAFQSLAGGEREINNPGAWLTTITANACRDVIRKKKRLQSGIDVDAIRTGGADNDPASEFELVSMRAEFTRLFTEEIGKLPDILRVPFELYLRKMPHKQIAGRLKITADASRKRVQIAKKALREVLGEQSPPVLEPALLYDTLGKLPPVEQDFDIPGNYNRLRVVAFPANSFRAYALLYVRDEPKHSFRFLNKYVEKHPGGWKKRLELGQWRLIRGEWRQAVADLREVAARRPERLDVHLLLMHVLFALGNRRFFLKQLERVRALPLSSAAVHHLEGRRLTWEGDFEGALPHFAEAGRLEPENTAHAYQSAFLELVRGNSACAIVHCDRILTRRRDDVIALTFRRDALELLGRGREAEYCTQRILEIYPNDVLALRHKILTECRVPSPCGRAVHPLLRKLDQLVPNTFLSVEMEIIYRLSLGERSQALEIFSRFLNAFPNDLGALYFAWNTRAHHFPVRAAARDFAQFRDPDVTLIFRRYVSPRASTE